MKSDNYSTIDLFNTWLEKQGQPPRSGLIFDRNKHRWVKPSSHEDEKEITIKPLKYSPGISGGMIEGTLPDGTKITQITSGKSKGRWMAIIGKTEIVGLTPQSTAKLVEREKSR